MGMFVRVWWLVRLFARRLIGFRGRLWLGHSDFSTTANIYAHLDYSSKLTSADAMLAGLGIE